MSTVATGRRSSSGTSERLRGLLGGLDWIMLLAVALISGLSIFIVGEATKNDVPGDPGFYVNRQIMFISVGTVLMIVATRLNLDKLARWAWGLWGGLLGSLAVVFVVGTAVKGSNRWIDIGPFNLQPSEIGKVLLAIILAGIAIERMEDVGSTRFTLFLFGVAAVPAAVVFLQPDLGTSLVYFAVLGAVLFLAGVPWSHFAVAGSVLAILILGVLWILPSAGVHVLQDYQVERLTAFIGAQRDSSDAGYQLDQSKTAIGSGGALGKGPGGATQANGDFIPEHHTDFIFAVIGERYGFVGAAVLLALFVVLIWRALRIATISRDLYGSMIAGCIAAIFLFEVFVNIGMTIGIMPITGIPLPFVSYGGAALITDLMLVGLLESVHLRGRLAGSGG